jgi:hypothetical protein
MQPVPAELVNRLRIDDAVDEELASYQGLLPTTPGWDQLAAQRPRFSRWLAGQLRSGLIVSPEVNVSVRKISHGIRPVPVWGLPERVSIQ